MKYADEPNEYYFYGQESRLPSDDIVVKPENKTTKVSSSLKRKENANLKEITTAVFVSRLTGMQVFSALIILMASILQVVSILTTDWFVLNVNEYIPTSKGGLWNYCYISSSNFNGLVGQYSCLKYEELPNFAVFINSRLYDSRILLVCSCGFSALILIIEIFGILALCLAERKVDMFDSFVANRSNRYRNNQTETRPKSVKENTELDETTNSARFTTSIIVNANLNERTYDNNNLNDTIHSHSSKPTGYYAYLAIALITLVGSVMDFVLKVSGFALFDSYIQNLLKFNTVFLAYRSFSYWMMVTSIGLMVLFWLFKVFSTRYVINLTKQLIKNRELLFSKQDNVSLTYSSPPHLTSQYQYDPFKTSKTNYLHYANLTFNAKRRSFSILITFLPKNQIIIFFYYTIKIIQQ